MELLSKVILPCDFLLQKWINEENIWNHTFATMLNLKYSTQFGPILSPILLLRIQNGNLIEYWKCVHQKRISCMTNVLFYILYQSSSEAYEHYTSRNGFYQLNWMASSIVSLPNWRAAILCCQNRHVHQIWSGRYHFPFHFDFDRFGIFSKNPNKR